MGLPDAGDSERQDVDAPVNAAFLGRLVELLTEG